MTIEDLEAAIYTLQAQKEELRKQLKNAWAVHGRKIRAAKVSPEVAAAVLAEAKNAEVSAPVLTASMTAN